MIVTSVINTVFPRFSAMAAAHDRTSPHTALPWSYSVDGGPHHPSRGGVGSLFRRCSGAVDQKR